MKIRQGGKIVDYDPFATEVHADAAAAVWAATDPEPQVEVAERALVPDGTVADVVDWVGDDEDRRRAALAAELAEDKPRKSLIERLS